MWCSMQEASAYRVDMNYVGAVLDETTHAVEVTTTCSVQQWRPLDLHRVSSAQCNAQLFT